jgi:hypothetical protein
MAPYISEQERREYGDAALSVMARKAREVVDPLAQNLLQQNREIQQRLQKLQARDIYAALDQAQPDWREINKSPDFWDWLRLPGELSGVEKQRMLNDAFSVGDTGRVLAFFRGYLTDRGQMRGRSSRSSTSRRGQTQQVIPRQAISEFYSTIARNPNSYTDQQKREIEAALHAAVVSGNVR